MYNVFDYYDKKKKYKVLYNTILNEEENIYEYKIDYVECYKLRNIIKIAHYFLCFLSFGLIPLILSWFPIFYFKLLHSKCALNECEKVLIVTKEGEKYVEKIKNVQLYNSINVVMNNHNKAHEDNFNNIKGFCSKNVMNNCKNTELKNKESDIQKYYSDIEDNYEKIKTSDEDSELDEYKYSTHIFEFLGVRYVYIRGKRCFVELHFYITYPLEYIHLMSDGLNSNKLIRDRKLVYGECNLNVQLDTILILLFKEIIHPFFIFQIFAMIIWSIDSYYEYALAILFITAISTIIELHSTRENQKKLKNLIDYKCLVQVHRYNSVSVLDSSDLVPGDIYEIETNMKIPCDTILLIGSATMSEHMLTGESVPINKSNLPFFDELDDVNFFKQAKNEKEKLNIIEKHTSDEDVELKEKNKKGVIRNSIDNNSSYSNLTKKDNYKEEKWNNKNLTRQKNIGMNNYYSIYNEKENTKKSIDNMNDLNNFISYVSDSTSTYYEIKKKKKIKELEKKYEEKISKHTLYAGTTVLSVNTMNVAKKKNKVLGLVIKTGFITAKGKIINNILHSKKARLNLIQDSYKFLAILAIYALVSGFIILILTIINNIFSSSTIIRCLDLITDAVPPALPTTLTVGITIAISRLKKKFSISCISPSRINLAGQINTMVFDKTGTLTENRLDFLGIIPNKNGNLNNFIPINNCERFPEDINKCNFSNMHNNNNNNNNSNNPETNHLLKENSYKKKDDNSVLTTIQKYINNNCNKEFRSLEFNKNIDHCEYHNFDKEINIKKVISDDCDTLNNNYINYYNESNHRVNINNFYNDDQYNHKSNSDNSNNCKNDFCHYNFDEKNNFNEIMKINYSLFLDALACCHSLTKINNELIGDILEILMFRSTNCNIEISENSVIIKESSNLNNNFFSSQEKNYNEKPIYYILKQFEFNSNLQRMSVIVKNVENGKYYLFCKGSPEKIKELCLKNKIPHNYDEALHKYAKLGMRIISLSYKELDANNKNILMVTRNSLEKNLSFLGFLIFANKLKNSAYDLINNLKGSGCQCIMSTGDNLLTSVSVAKQCGIINENIESIIIGDVITVKNKKKLVWYVDKNDNIFKNENIDINIYNKKEKINDKNIDENTNNDGKDRIFENETESNVDDITIKINNCNNELYKNKDDKYEEDFMKNNSKCYNSNMSKNLKKDKKKKIEKYSRNSKLVFDDLCEILIHRDPRSIGIVLSGEAFIFLKKEFECLDLPFYDECEKITYNIMKNNSKKKKNKVYYNSKIIPQYIENLHNKNFCYNKLFYKIQSKLLENLSKRILKKRQIEGNKNYMINNRKNPLIYKKYFNASNSIHSLNTNKSDTDGAVCLNHIKKKDENKKGNSEILKNRKKNNFLNIKKYIKITQKRKIMDALLMKQDSDQKEVMSESLSVNSLNNTKSLKIKKINRFNNLTKSVFSYPKPLLSLCIIKEKKFSKMNYFFHPERNFFLRIIFRITNYMRSLIKRKKKKVKKFSKSEEKNLLEINSFIEENYELSKLDNMPENQYTLDIYSNIYKKKNKEKKKKNNFFLCDYLKKKKFLFFKSKLFYINSETGMVQIKEKKKFQNSSFYKSIYLYSSRKYKKLKQGYLFNNNDNSCITTLSTGSNKKRKIVEKAMSIVKYKKYENSEKENDMCIVNGQQKCVENNENIKNNIYVNSYLYKNKENFKNNLYYKCKYQTKKKKNKIINKKNIYINKNKLLMNNYLGCLKQSLYHECRTDTCYRYSHIKNIKLTIYEYILRSCTVYARMKPEYKTQLILSLKNLPHMPFVGMCGDGSNDCGALNCADIGISLSHNESSICAPFTSDNFYLNSVINVLVEGRAALVNSFQLFKFISLYSVMQCSVVLILYAFSNNLTDNQFIFTDIFTILPLSIFMSWTSASEKLSSNLPLGKLFCFPVLFSIYGQIIIQLFFIFISILLLLYQPFYKNDTNAFPFGDTTNKKLISTKNTLIYILSSFQILFICISLNIKTEWRKSVLTNAIYLVWILILILINIFITLFTSDTFLIGSLVHFLKKYLNLVNFPVYFRFYLSAILIINFICTYYFEKYFVRYLEKKEMKKNYKYNHINIFPVPNELDTKVFVTCL